MDSCDIDSRFQCNYGDAFTCKNNVDDFGVSSFDFEKQCTCYSGIFACYSNACPEPCPDVEPESGSSCSPFETFSCGYDEYCCDGADDKTCVAMTECYCDYDLTTICNEPSINCPSKCPEIKPENGQSCDMEERLICSYNEGMCPTSECKCVQGVYVCSEFCYDIAYGEDMNTADLARETDDVSLAMPLPPLMMISKASPKRTRRRTRRAINPGQMIKKVKKEKIGEVQEIDDPFGDALYE